MKSLRNLGFNLSKEGSNNAMQSATEPRRAYFLAYPEVPWLRGSVPPMAGIGHEEKL